MGRVIETEGLQCAFTYDGKISSILVNRTLQAADTSVLARGFFLSNGYDEIQFVSLDYADGILTCYNFNKTQCIKLAVVLQQNYIGFRLLSLFGIPRNDGYMLHFEARGNNLHLVELDYMTEVETSADGVRAVFPYLYHTNAGDPLGGFALFYAASPAQEDEILLQLWVGEQLAHPITNEPWTLDTARAWLDDFLAKYKDRSQMIVKAQNKDELYAMTPYLEQMGAKQVYLFTDTWRTDDFWPITDVNWGINQKVFPHGKVDLKAYPDYLAARDIKLILHYVSGGIGFFDPQYVADKPDKRLAKWGKLSLAQDISVQEREIVFVPEADLEVPYNISHKMRFKKMPALPQFYKFNYLLLEDEIIRFTEVVLQADGTWCCKGCRRGMFLTKATAHSACAETLGLIAAYDINFVPANDSDLLDEIAEGYASLINDCNIAHTEFDGGEIHCYQPWGYRKFTEKVYQN